MPQRAKRTPSANAFLEICTARAIATKMMIIPMEKTAPRPIFCLGARRTVYKRFSGREMIMISVRTSTVVLYAMEMVEPSTSMGL